MITLPQPTLPQPTLPPAAARAPRLTPGQPNVAITPGDTGDTFADTFRSRLDQASDHSTRGTERGETERARADRPGNDHGRADRADKDHSNAEPTKDQPTERTSSPAQDRADRADDSGADGTGGDATDDRTEHGDADATERVAPDTPDGSHQRDDTGGDDAPGDALVVTPLVVTPATSPTDATMPRLSDGTVTTPTPTATVAAMADEAGQALTTPLPEGQTGGAQTGRPAASGDNTAAIAAPPATNPGQVSADAAAVTAQPAVSALVDAPTAPNQGLDAEVEGEIVATDTASPVDQAGDDAAPPLRTASSTGLTAGGDDPTGANGNDTAGSRPSDGDAAASNTMDDGPATMVRTDTSVTTTSSTAQTLPAGAAAAAARAANTAVNAAEADADTVVATPASTTQALGNGAVASTELTTPARLSAMIAPEAARLRGTATHRTLEVRLDPPDLGTVDIEIRTSGSTVSVVARTESADAMLAVLRQRESIEASLREHGMDLGGFDVSTGTPDRDQADRSADVAPAALAGAADDAGDSTEPGDQPSHRTNQEGSVFL